LAATERQGRRRESEDFARRQSAAALRVCGMQRLVAPDRNNI
jgi:hypothetical protein